MKVCRIVITSSIGSLTAYGMKYTLNTLAKNVYFSTIQGILSRLYDRPFKIEELLPLSFAFKHDDIYYETMQFKKPDKNRPRYLATSTLQRGMFSMPTLVIYANRKLCDMEQVNGAYVFSPEYPGDVYFDEVELVPLSEYDGKVRPYGAVTDRPYRETIMQFGAYEFDYINNGTRHVVKNGVHYYFRNTLPVERKLGIDFDVEELDERFGYGITKNSRMFVDEDVGRYDGRFRNQLVTLFEKHPREVYGVM